MMKMTVIMLAVAGACGLAAANDDTETARRIMNVPPGEEINETHKQAPTPAAAPAAGEKAAEKAGEKPDPKKDIIRPVKGEIISPDATNAVDQEDLIKRLTGEDKGGAGPDKKFEEIIGRMGDSAKRLKKEDAGPVTVEIQNRIVLDLDDLIEMAKKSQSQGQGQSKPQDGQKKQQSSGQKQGSQPGQGQGGNNAAQQSTMRDGTATAQPGQDIHEKGAEGWGNLPAKDRDLITQSQREDMLPSYRQAIEKYYEELAKLNRAGQSNK